MIKLTLVTAAVLGMMATSTAMAQSTVTLYGIADAGYNRVTGLKNGTVNTIASGIGSGSRFGFRGTEDLGGGYKAIFTMENRLELDTGSVTNRPNSSPNLPDRFSNARTLGLTSLSPADQAKLVPAANNLGANVAVNAAGNLFDRQAFAGLVTPFGAITLGRQYTPAFIAQTTFDTTAADTALGAGGVAAFPGGVDIRLSNTVQYALQQSGVTASLMYGAGEVAGDSAKGRFYGVMAIYKGEGFSVGGGYNRANNTLGEKALSTAVIGGTLTAGPGTVYAQYNKIKNENPQNALSISAANGGFTPAFGANAPLVLAAYKNAFQQDGNLMHIGYKMTSGVNTIAVTYSRYDDKRPENADVTSYGVAYYYALSKRTQLQAIVSRFNNKGQAQTAPGGGGFLGGFTGSAGQDSTGLGLGIRHTF